MTHCGMTNIVRKTRTTEECTIGRNVGSGVHLESGQIQERLAVWGRVSFPGRTEDCRRTGALHVSDISMASKRPNYGKSKILLVAGVGSLEKR